MSVEDQVIGVLHKTPTCDLEEATHQCAHLTWNQVFLAVDRLSRIGKIILKTRGRGMYSLTVPQRQEDLSNQRAFPS